MPRLRPRLLDVCLARLPRLAWRPLVLTLGARPVDALAPLSGDPAPEAPVVLVCDQLEQLWSPEVPDVERAAFLDTVLGLVADDVVARALLVVRGDHVGRLAEHPDLTLEQIRDRLHLECSLAAICRTLQKLNLTRKKNAARGRAAVLA